MHSQQHAANAEESSAASKEMDVRAKQMKEFVEGLQTIVDGNVIACCWKRRIDEQKTVTNMTGKSSISYEDWKHVHSIPPVY